MYSKHTCQPHTYTQERIRKHPRSTQLRLQKCTPVQEIFMQKMTPTHQPLSLSHTHTHTQLHTPTLGTHEFNFVWTRSAVLLSWCWSSETMHLCACTCKIRKYAYTVSLIHTNTRTYSSCTYTRTQHESSFGVLIEGSFECLYTTRILFSKIHTKPYYICMSDEKILSRSHILCPGALF